MEASDEVSGAAANNIVKGKRTKRQRVQSPIPNFALTANSSSIDNGDGDADGDGDRDTKNSRNVSPSTSQEFLLLQESTEEEEDMANCLILLAQGHFRDLPKQNDENTIDYVLPATTTTTITAGNKFNSRRFMETGAAGAGSGKGGYYVYECKTCCRTFPSFQALGGHRASHKKPKLGVNDDKKLQLTNNSSDEEFDVLHYKDISSLSLQLTNISNSNTNTNNNNSRSIVNLNNHNIKANKVHECSICGAEFTSGQALGGHMRRHRAPVAASAAASRSLALTSTAVMESHEPKKERNLLSLNLDLNLPAPDDEKQNLLASKQQQQQQQSQPKQDQTQKSPLVFSGPALVDCHY